MYNIKQVVAELMEFGGIKVQAISYDAAVSIRWKINKELRDIHVKGFATAIIFEDVTDTVVAWSIDRFLSVKINSNIISSINLKIPSQDIEYKRPKTITPTEDKWNIDKNEPWIDPANKEILEQMARDRKEKEEQRLQDIIDKMGTGV